MRSQKHLVLLAPLIVAGWFATYPAEKGEAAVALALRSDSFDAGGEIPAVHTCEGANRSPHLGWAGAPEGTRSLALIVDDPDAPDPQAPKMTWVPWVVYNLPPETAELRAGSGGDDLPAGSFEGLNDWRRTGYGGPCPPIGRHRYFHKLYALDTKLPAHEGATKQWLEQAMAGHILAQAELVGTYQKQR